MTNVELIIDYQLPSYLISNFKTANDKISYSIVEC